MALENRLRHDVVVQRATEGARDERGNPALTWSTLRTIRGWYQPKSRSERDEAGPGGAVAERGVVFVKPTDLTESDRLVIGGTTYGIESVHDAAGKGHHYEVAVHRAEPV